jgi:hypothetical protein
MSFVAKCVRNQREKNGEKLKILGAEKGEKASDIINRYELDNPQLNKSWRWWKSEREMEANGARNGGRRTVWKFLYAEGFLCHFIDDDSEEKKCWYVHMLRYVEKMLEMATCWGEKVFDDHFSWWIWRELIKKARK